MKRDKMGKDYSLDLDRFPKELVFLLNMLRFENDKNIIINSFEGISDIDWDLLLKLAFHHRLYPKLYSKLKLIDQKSIPSYVVQTIYNEYKKNTFEMLHLTAEMEKLANIFAVSGIRLLILKGPVLAYDLYKDLSLRTCSDLDVLVPISDLEQVDTLLLSLGYEKDEYFQIDKELNDWRWRHHHIMYLHPSKRVKVEIHWRLNPGPSKEPTFDELWERKRISSLTTQPVYFLGREDLFFFLITHGARHGWFRLRWLLDIHEIVGQGMDWIKVINNFKIYQCFQLGGQALILSSKLLKTQLNGDILQLTRGKDAHRLAKNTMFYLEKIVNLHTEPLPEYIEKYHNRYLYSLKSKQYKFLYLISVFYPSITDVRTIKLPKSLYFLYFPLRPILLTLRRRRKQSSF